MEKSTIFTLDDQRVAAEMDFFSLSLFVQLVPRTPVVSPENFDRREPGLFD